MKHNTYILISFVILLYSLTTIRNVNANGGSCAIPLLENDYTLKFVPDNEECNKINQDYKVDENYKFINYFGNVFDELMKGIESLVIPNQNTKMNVIFFVGNTGSGKTTSVQILAGDNTKIFSKPVRENSDDFIVVDYNKIGTDTITSETLYPDLVKDNQTGYVFGDNPGFRDTRSPLHEIVSMYSMRRVLKYTDNIKIVLVTTRSSLKVGMYRDDFLNSLKHLTEFIHDLPKYEKSLFLLGTKVENSYVIKKGFPQLVTDNAIITDIGYYLNEVKLSLSDKTNLFNITDNKKEFYEKSTKIIERFLEKNNDDYSKIQIIRRPDDVGPISGLEKIQEERKKIRDMLLKHDNFVQVNSNDFGLPLTDSSLLFLNDLYLKMDSYVNGLSKLVSIYLNNRYESYLNSNYNLINAIEKIINIKSKTRSFSNEIGAAKNPGQFIESVQKFSDSNNLKLNCLVSFKDFSTIDKFLTGLQDLTNAPKYNPLAWNMTMKITNDYIERKLDEYSLLKDVFDLLSSYKIQQNRQLYNVRDLQHWGSANKEQGLEINKNNFKLFLEKVNLNNRYSLLTDNQELINKLNSIIRITLHRGNTIICKDETLTIINYHITLSELDGKYPHLCGNAKRIEFYALHTLFLDRDLTGGWFSEKHITMISPVWTIVGTHTISVEGANGGGQLPKANTGEVGLNGVSGRPGGRIFGIGQIFNNGENLLLNVKGGDGQNGQDGGDGLNGGNGGNGHDGDHAGQPGAVGGDSGAGGRGGFAGAKGFVYLHNVGNANHRVQFNVNDGRPGVDGQNGSPGIGGVKGCDLHIEVKRKRIFGIRVSKKTIRTFVNCGTVRSRSGFVRNRSSDPVPFYHQNIPIVPPCTHITIFRQNFIDHYKSILSDGITETFINKMISFKY